MVVEVVVVVVVVVVVDVAVGVGVPPQGEPDPPEPPQVLTFVAIQAPKPVKVPLVQTTYEPSEQV